MKCFSDSKNVPGKEEKIMNMEEVKKNLECNKENLNVLKSEAKYNKKCKCISKKY